MKTRFLSHHTKEKCTRRRTSTHKYQIKHYLCTLHEKFNTSNMMIDVK